MTGVDAPTQQQPVAVPAPTVGPVPATDPDATPAGYVGRHRARCGHAAQPTVTAPVTADHSPLAPAVRHQLAPGWWSARRLPAGVDDRTAFHRPADIHTTRTEESTTA